MHNTIVYKTKYNQLYQIVIATLDIGNGDTNL